MSRRTGFPRALTAVREFHRLSSRWHELGLLTLAEARQLAGLKGRFEPARRPEDDDWSPLLIVDRRPVVVCGKGWLARGQLVAFALRTALLQVAVPAIPGDRLKVAIPRRPDGRWHRFHAQIVRVDRTRGRVTVGFLRPVGDAAGPGRSAD